MGNSKGLDVSPWRASGATAWRVLRAEGAAAARDRALDRFAAWRRRRTYRLVERVDPSGLDLPAPPGEPVIAVLNVLPTPPRADRGGVQVQLLQRLEAEAAKRPVALLYPEASGYRLEIRAGGRRRAVEYRAPVTVARDRLADAVFTRVVRHAARRVGARGVHFEQLVGLPLRTPAELRENGLRLVVSVHDFGLFCLRPHLVERPALRFCDYSREPQRCARCLAADWRLDDGFQELRRELAGEVLRSADAVIYPSDFLRRTYAGLVAGLQPARQRVVEPPPIAAAAEVPRPRPRLPVRHLAYVGSVQPHKGALVLEELIRRLGDPPPDLRWSVYGGGDREILERLRRLPAVEVRGYYRAGELPRRLRSDRVDLALLLSIWPESYALTLDECLLAGVPVLAFDHGAPGERLRRLGAGVLIDPAGGTDAVLAGVREVLESGWRPAVASGSAFAPPAAGTSAGECLEIYRRIGLDPVAGAE